MSDRSEHLSILLVDPINYSGMAYYDAGLAAGLASAGAHVTVAGSDEALVLPAEREGLRFMCSFVGTGPGRAKWQRAAAYVLSSARLVRELRRQPPDWLLWNYFEQPTIDRFVIRRADLRWTRVGFIAHEVEPWENDAERRDDYRWLIEDASDAVIVHGKANEEALHASWNVPRERVIVSEHGDYGSGSTHPRTRKRRARDWTFPRTLPSPCSSVRSG